MGDTRKSIGIIGFGNMGQAIGERLKAKYEVWVFDKDKDKTKRLLGINAADNTADLINKVDAIILAVKPQDFDTILNEIKNSARGKLIISIAAGITTAYIENNLLEARVVRVMPNIGARIGEAQTSLCAGKSALFGDLAQAKELFGHIGRSWEISEKMMDAATAICGSGPAYIFYDMEKNHIDPGRVPEETEKKYIHELAIAAEKVGFDSDTALELAAATTSTSLRLAKMAAPKELREQVTSKGGTTEAALRVLSAGGSWADAATAALRCAKELSKQE